MENMTLKFCGSIKSNSVAKNDNAVAFFVAYITNRTIEDGFNTLFVRPHCIDGEDRNR